MFEKRPPRLYNNVDLDDYEKFVDIERCVHIEDILDYNRDTLSPSKLSRKDQSHLEDKGLFVLWFGIASSSSTHNVYGNVSFILRFQKLLNQFHSCRKLYYLETVERTDSVLSRLLFTARDINELKPAIELNLRNFGHPLLQDESGNYYHLKSIPGYKNGHNLEILIDMPKRRLSDGKWLFNECRKIPVNHQKANSIHYNTGNYKLCQCYKYNNRQKPCPHPFNEEETYDHMKKECPRFLDIKKNNNARDILPSMNKVSEESMKPSHSYYNPTLPHLRKSHPPTYQPGSIASSAGFSPTANTSTSSTSTHNSNIANVEIASRSMVVKPVTATRISIERVNHLPSTKQKPCQPSNQRSASSHPARTSTYTQNSITVSRPSSQQHVTATDAADKSCYPCPKCRVGEVSKQCCSFWFFPLYFLCCLEKKDRQCNSCGAKFRKSELSRTRTRI